MSFRSTQKDGATVRRFDLGGCLLFLYILAFSREYTWPIHTQFAAWTVAVLLAAAVWWCYVLLTPKSDVKPPRPFWLLVALPLFLIYVLRVELPDTSFDVLNYHIFQAERSLRGSLYAAGDFFQNTPFNPAPDILTAFYRHALGYRLGTLVNYLAVIWTGGILYRLLRAYFNSVWLICAAVLFILLTEQILFQINNYMVDLLPLPLMLEACRIAIQTNRPGSESFRNDATPFESENAGSINAKALRLALLLGISAALKLSNLVFGIPIILVFAYNCLARSPKKRTEHVLRLLKIAPVAALVLIAPLVPFALASYRLTGSPVFPFYNGIFRSPYWPQGKFFDPRWGPFGLRETVFWPVIVFFKPERMCELPVYSGRISIGVIIAALLFIFLRGASSIRQMSFITLCGAFLWSAGTGYARYAIFLELTSGVVLIWFVWFVWRQCARLSIGARLLIQVPLWLAMLGQAALALTYANRYEWSMRAPLFQHRARLIVEEAKQFLRDRSLIDYLSAADESLLDDVDVWVDTTDKTSALEVLLKPHTPVLGVRSPPFFSTEQSRAKFDEALRADEGKRLFTLTRASDLPTVEQLLAPRGLVTGKSQDLSIPYFSQSEKLDMLLVEVRPSPQTPSVGMPLADEAFKAQLFVANLPASLRAGEKYAIQVSLKNESRFFWPGRQPTWQYQITLGDRWLNENGAIINELDGRTLLAHDLGPGQDDVLSIEINAPKVAGNYVLQFDAIQEGVAWFSEKGSKPLNLKIKIE